MDLRLKDKVAWVAGSSRGIGLAVARRLAEEGCRVALSGRNREDIDRALRTFEAEFGKRRAAAFAGDLIEEKFSRDVVEGCRSLWGRLDILVANVGTGRVAGGAAPSDSEWDLALEQNLRVAIQTIRQAQPLLETSGSGNVVVVGSIAGLEDLGAPVAYSTAKAALHAWAKALARQVAAKRIRVNIVIPGNIYFPGGTWDIKQRENQEGVQRYIQSEVPMARFGTPEEIADAVAFMASERASFITGSSLVVDGGQTRSLS